MKRSIVHVALVVRNQDDAIRFFTEKLNFVLLDDAYMPEQDKRWVLVGPPGTIGTSLLLQKAKTPEAEALVGAQTAGRVFLFLHTDDFWHEYHRMLSVGIEFVEGPRTEYYGTVAVFKDLYGNLWDLLEWNSEYAERVVQSTGARWPS